MKIIQLLIAILVGTSERPEVKIDWRIYTKNPDNPLNKRFNNRRS